MRLFKSALTFLALGGLFLATAKGEPKKWEHGQGWGWVWGDEDEVGALNEMTPETILQALVTGHIDQHSAGDDRRDSLRSGLSHPPVAPPFRFGETVVPMVVLTRHGMAQSVDLGGHVVIDE